MNYKTLGIIKISIKFYQNTYLIQIASLVFMFFQCFGLLQVRGMKFESIPSHSGIGKMPECF